MANRSDNFNRANNSTVLGTPSDAGSDWGQAGGDPFGIISNQAYTDGGSQRTVYLQCSASDGTVQMTVATAGNGELAVVARLSSASDFISLQKSGSSLYLRKCVGGTYYTLGTPYGGSYASGDVIAITCSDDQITAKLNGNPIIGPVTESFNSTATFHGMIGYSDTTSRIDDWSWTDGGGGSSAKAPLTAGLTHGILTRGRLTA